MAEQVPFWITLVVTLAKVGFTLMVWGWVYVYGRRGAGGPRLSGAGFAWFSVLWLGWAVVSTILAVEKVFTLFFFVPLLLAGSLALGYVAYRQWPGLKETLDAVPQSWLIAGQVMRVIGGVFLVLLGMGLLPREFALPAGIGDVITGIAAPFVAYAMARNLPNARGWAIAWNVFGTLDLVVAVSTGFIASPLLARVFDIHPTTTLLPLFPLVQIPGFLVPAVILLHALSLRGLLAGRVSRTPTPAAA